MNAVTQSDAGSEHQHRAATTDLVLGVFRLNGVLLAFGDAMVEDLGLTSARWQVLGAIALSPVPLPVAHIARNMGLTRQGVQRTVDDLLSDAMVRLDINPHHRRAMLVLMTERGHAAYAAAIERQERWADHVISDLELDAVRQAVAVVQTMRQRIENAMAQPGKSWLPPT